MKRSLFDDFDVDPQRVDIEDAASVLRPQVLTCAHCGHRWISGTDPKVCPRCHNDWRTPGRGKDWRKGLKGSLHKRLPTQGSFTR